MLTSSQFHSPSTSFACSTRRGPLCIIKSADQQASTFLHGKLKVTGPEGRARIVDGHLYARWEDDVASRHARLSNWAVRRYLEAATGPEQHREIVVCMRDRIVDLAPNCCGYRVLQKALEVCLLIVSELLRGDPATALVNKRVSHVWSKLSWNPPAPPIVTHVNKSLKGRWAALACHETESLVVQHAFENPEESAKGGIADELLGQDAVVFSEVAKSQWAFRCIQCILEHGSDKHRRNDQRSKSVVKALKEGGKEMLDRVVQRMCEPAKVLVVR